MKLVAVFSHPKLKALLAKKPVRVLWNSGRWLALAIVALYVFQLVSYSRIGNYEYIWGKLGVPVMQRHFSDLQSVLSAFDCTRLGYNVLISNPCDAIWPNLNYPLIWMKLTPLGLTQADTDWLGIVLGSLFILTALLVARPLNLAEGLVYGLILISPSVMLGVERGNVDLVLFILLGLAWLLLDDARFGNVRFVAYGLVYLAVLLKLYPVFGFAVILREKTKACLAALAICGLASVGYLLSDLNQFQLVYSYYPQETVYSFGRMVLPKILNDSGITRSLFGMPLSPAVLGWASAITIAVLALAALALAWRVWASGNPVPLDQDWRLDGFRIGAAIFIGCFALGYNYDYRLVFTIFTVPLMLGWLKDARSGLRVFGGAGLAALVLTLWLSRWSTVYTFFSLPDKYFVPDEILNWFLLFFYSCGLFITLPAWLWSPFATHFWGGRPAIHQEGALSNP